MNLENTKVYTKDTEVIRKYAELCGHYGEIVTHGSSSIGFCYNELLFSDFFKSTFVDVNNEYTTITPDQINALYAEKFGNHSEAPNGSEWDSKGLPPVGTKCIYFVANQRDFPVENHLREMTCVAHVGVGLAVLVSEDFSFSTVCNDAWIRKPETEAERLERQRLEAAYDLYCAGCKAVGDGTRMNFDTFKKHKDFYLAIVDKTGYRKQKDGE